MGQGTSSTASDSYDNEDEFRPSTLRDEVLHLVGDESELQEVVFSWSGGGAEVTLTGSFQGWGDSVAMEWDADAQAFVKKLMLPVGKHQYKFIVDGTWRFASDQPTEKDAEGRINNVLVVSVLDEESETEEKSLRDSFGQLIPEFEDYSYDPPTLPPHLAFIPLNAPPDDPLRVLDPVVLPFPQHVTLNHLYMSARSKRDSNEENQVIVLGMTQRYKTKFITTVYYKPKPLPAI